MSYLEKLDPEIFNLIREEGRRQKLNIELIASENFVSPAVMEAAGSILTNKYAEGYPERRYYGGCEVVDEVEKLAIERAKELFQGEHVNVQPHSGSQANQAVYFAAVPQGGTILAMDLTHGGHLTHGSPVNLSGRYYNFVHYGVDRESETIDFDQVAELAAKHKPALIVSGASAYPRIIDFEGSAGLQMKMVPFSWWIWPISLDWWQQACIQILYPMQISLQLPPIKP